MRIYLGGPMFTSAEKRYNLWLADQLRGEGYEVYCPNESEPINDKTRDDITSRMVYEFDLEALEGSNLYLCQVSEDSGTNWEAGYFDCLSRHVDPERYWGVLGLATDLRLAATPHPAKSGIENPAHHVNQFVAGALLSSLGVVYDEDELLDRLREIASERDIQAI